MTTGPYQRWIPPKLAAQILGCSTNDLLTLSKLGLITRKSTCGGHGRYCVEDLALLINYRQDRVSEPSLALERNDGFQKHSRNPVT